MADEDETQAPQQDAPPRASDDNMNLEDLSTAAPTQTAVAEAPAEDDAEDGEDVVRTATDLEAVFDIPVKVSAVLGKSSLQVSQLLRLGRGAVIELDRKVGEAIDIYVNNRLVARGEVVLVDDRLGVTMTEIIKGDS